MPRRKSGEEKLIETLGKVVRKSATKSVKQMANMLLKETRKTAGWEDHSLNELRRLGHPYGKGTPKSGKVRGEIPHTPEWLVHKQSNELYDNIKIFETNRKDELEVGVDSSDVSYIKYVIEGTHKMIARDFIRESFNNIKKKLRKKYNNNIKKAIKDMQKIIDKG